MKTDALKEIAHANLSLLENLGQARTYKQVATQLQSLMNSQHATIFLTEGEKLKRVYSTVPRANRITPRKHGYTRKAIQEIKPCVINEKQIRASHPESRNNTKTIVIIPLIYDRRGIGALTVQYASNVHITPQHLDVLQLYASVASFAIKNAELMRSLKKTLAVRDLFISTAAHELKTPLTAISLYANLMKKNAQTQKLPNPTWIQNLSEQVTRLNNMFEDFLSLEKMRMDELKYRFTRVRLIVLVDRALENFRIKHGKRAIEFVNLLPSGTAAETRGDFDKLLQVLNNILNNAAKFSPRTSVISVSLLQTKNGYFRITIEDRGIGIDKKDVNKIFQKYYTTKARNKEGMGIGMYLTKKIMEKHRGQIRVVSEKGSGTIVSITFPKIS